MTKKQKQAAGTSERILDVAEELVQRRGFNGFSYADIASEMGITTASLHYHFAGKSDLGRALIERYAERFSTELERIGKKSPDARARLAAYADLYAGVLKDDRFCLCGMLAAEYETLPDEMRRAVVKFFDLNEVWVSEVLAGGRKDGVLDFDGTPADSARMLVGTLEGAMLVARPYGRIDRFRTAAAQLLRGFSAS